MSMLADLDHFWGGDLAPNITGDLTTQTGTARGQQRVLRRLLTNPGDYLWHPDYGAGLPLFVGQPIDVSAVVGTIRAQMLREAAVAQVPEPKITVRQLPSDLTAFFVSIAYNDAPSGQPVVLAFNVSN